tara:strand:+ start:321 stop:554 length:234 start_codon:yes stop_codon:yes gene_type:complete
MVKRGLVIVLIIFVIFLIVGGFYLKDLLSEFEGNDEEDADSELIRYENPPIPEWAVPAGGFSEDEESGPIFENGGNS